jgi:pimeloyl-ACP methyl ester carboxylesterase
MSQVTSRDGTKIAYDQQGEGPPVILVGGAFQYRSFDPRTQQLAGLLAEKFTVIHYDRRGRGESGDTQPYDVRREVEDLGALIAEVGGQAAVFGMSSGAALVIEAAASGLPITKLAVYEPPFIVGDDRSPVPADLAERLSRLVAEGNPGDAVALFLTTAADVPAEFVAPMKDTPMWSGFEAAAPSLAYDVKLLGDGSVPADQAAKITIPTLVADGGASPAWMRNAAAALAKALPSSQTATLDGQAHGAAPDLLAPVLISFFEK